MANGPKKAGLVDLVDYDYLQFAAWCPWTSATPAPPCGGSSPWTKNAAARGTGCRGKGVLSRAPPLLDSAPPGRDPRGRGPLGGCVSTGRTSCEGLPPKGWGRRPARRCLSGNILLYSDINGACWDVIHSFSILFLHSPMMIMQIRLLLLWYININTIFEAGCCDYFLYINYR